MSITTGVPYKSVAAALLLALFLGPIGVFYSSLIGGVVMTLFGLSAVGMLINQGALFPLGTVWLLSVVWAMISIRYYNRTLWKTVLTLLQPPQVKGEEVSCHEPQCTPCDDA